MQLTFRIVRVLHFSPLSHLHPRNITYLVRILDMQCDDAAVPRLVALCARVHAHQALPPAPRSRVQRHIACVVRDAAGSHVLSASPMLVHRARIVQCDDQAGAQRPRYAASEVYAGGGGGTIECVRIDGVTRVRVDEAALTSRTEVHQRVLETLPPVPRGARAAMRRALGAHALGEVQTLEQVSANAMRELGATDSAAVRYALYSLHDVFAPLAYMQLLARAYERAAPLIDPAALRWAPLHALRRIVTADLVPACVRAGVLRGNPGTDDASQCRDARMGAVLGRPSAAESELAWGVVRTLCARYRGGGVHVLAHTMAPFLGTDTLPRTFMQCVRAMMETSSTTSPLTIVLCVTARDAQCASQALRVPAYTLRDACASGGGASAVCAAATTIIVLEAHRMGVYAFEALMSLASAQHQQLVLVGDPYARTGAMRGADQCDVGAVFASLWRTSDEQRAHLGLRSVCALRGGGSCLAFNDACGVPHSLLASDTLHARLCTPSPLVTVSVRDQIMTHVRVAPQLPPIVFVATGAGSTSSAALQRCVVGTQPPKTTTQSSSASDVRYVWLRDTGALARVVGLHEIVPRRRADTTAPAAVCMGGDTVSVRVSAALHALSVLELEADSVVCDHRVCCGTDRVNCARYAVHARFLGVYEATTANGAKAPVVYVPLVAAVRDTAPQRRVVHFGAKATRHDLVHALACTQHLLVTPSSVRVLEQLMTTTRTGSTSPDALLAMPSMAQAPSTLSPVIMPTATTTQSSSSSKMRVLPLRAACKFFEQDQRERIVSVLAMLPQREVVAQSDGNECVPSETAPSGAFVLPTEEQLSSVTLSHMQQWLGEYVRVLEVRDAAADQVMAHNWLALGTCLMLTCMAVRGNQALEQWYVARECERWRAAGPDNDTGAHRATLQGMLECHEPLRDDGDSIDNVETSMFLQAVFAYRSIVAQLANQDGVVDDDDASLPPVVVASGGGGDDSEAPPSSR